MLNCDYYYVIAAAFGVASFLVSLISSVLYLAFQYKMRSFLTTFRRFGVHSATSDMQLDEDMRVLRRERRIRESEENQPLVNESAGSRPEAEKSKRTGDPKV